MSHHLMAEALAMLTPGRAYRPRACAFLTRIVLEEWVRENSATLDTHLPQASLRAQLLCLDHTVGVERAVRATVRWHELSAACHHHSYELPPSAGHLRRLWCDVDELVRS